MRVRKDHKDHKEQRKLEIEGFDLFVASRRARDALFFKASHRTLKSLRSL
jgi:hypothetical protein